MKKKFPTWLPLVALGLIAIATHLAWFHPTSMILGNDWWRWSDEMVRSLLSLNRGTWRADGGVGEPFFQIGFNVFFIPWGLIGQYVLGSKLVTFIPLAFLSLFAPYWFARHFSHNRAAAFVVALFYAFNTYFASKQSDHVPIAMVVALTPLLFVIADKLRQQITWRRLALFSLLFMLSCGYEIRMSLILAGMLLLYAALFWRELRVTPTRLGGFVLLNLGLNLFWLLPTLLIRDSGVASLTTRGVFGDWLFDLPHALTITNSSWTGYGQGVPFVLNPVLPWLWVGPLVALAVFLYPIKKIDNTDRRYLLFFGILTLVGVFLTKQSTEPLAGAYGWLFDNVPGFNLFREASKFYLITLTGYLGLLTLSLKYWLPLLAKRHHLIPTAALILLGLVFSINAYPMLTGQLSALFRNNPIPEEYRISREYRGSPVEHARTLWIPRPSRWSHADIYTPRYPAVDAYYHYANEPALPAAGEDFPTQLLSPLLTDYGRNWLNISGIRYLAVASNDDHFEAYPLVLDQIENLEKSFQSDEIILYENTHVLPYIHPTTTLSRVNEQTDSIDGIQNIVGSPAHHWTTSTNDLSNLQQARFYALFEDPETEAQTIGDNQSTQSQVVESDTAQSGTLYSRLDRESLTMRWQDNVFLLTLNNDSPGALSLNGKELPKSDQTIYRRTFLPGTSPLLVSEDLVKPVPEGVTPLLLDSPDTKVELLELRQDNLIPNPGFEDGLWQDQVNDCNNYDDEPILGMQRLPSGRTENTYMLQLSAARHVACTSQEIPLPSNRREGAKVLLSFDYQLPNPGTGGIYIQSDATAESLYQERISSSDSEWKTKTLTIPVPTDASELSLAVYAYSREDGITNIVVNYENFSLQMITPVETITPSSQVQTVEDKLRDGTMTWSWLHGQEVRLVQGPNTLALTHQEVVGNNLIANPYFEEGPWQEQVTSCHAYDDNPIIDMRLNADNRTVGSASLELEAARQVACIRTQIPVEGGKRYRFSFDLQSDIGSTGGFHLGFTGSETPSLSKRIPTPTTSWQTISEDILVPEETSQLGLHIYAYSREDGSPQVVRYDNFQLVEISPAAGNYWLTTNTSSDLALPSGVDFTIVSATNKQVAVTSATTGFFLVMAEQYHPQWELILGDSPDLALPHFFWPWRNLPGVDPMHHFRINDQFNGWYIDVEQWCEIENHCVRNHQGGYDFTLTIEFWPQRFFYLGLAITTLTLLTSLTFLGYTAWRKKHPLAKAHRSHDEP